MTKQERINELERENQAQRRNIADLKYRHDEAIQALGYLAEGRGLVEDGKFSMAAFARDRLVKIAKMALREAP